MNLPSATSAMIPAKYRALGRSDLLISMAAPWSNSGTRRESDRLGAVFLVHDPFAHAAQRLDAVVRTDIGEAAGITQRHEPLGTMKGEAIAQFRAQRVGIDSDRLRVGVGRTNRRFQTVERHQIRHAISQQPGEIDGLVHLRDDDGASDRGYDL